MLLFNRSMLSSTIEQCFLVSRLEKLFRSLWKPHQMEGQRQPCGVDRRFMPFTSFYGFGIIRSLLISGLVLCGAGLKPKSLQSPTVGSPA